MSVKLWVRSLMWRPRPGMRVRTVRDIGVTRNAIHAGTNGEILEVHGARKVLVRFANGRTLEVSRATLEPR